jgi:hypothetical protein
LGGGIAIRMNYHGRQSMDIRNLFAGAIGAAIASLGLWASPTEAAGLPLVISATVNYSQKTLNISGQNFGGSPSVTLNSMTFSTLSSASNQIVAKFPDAAPPSSFVPGTYFLTIQSRNQLPAIFTIDIGANGVSGPAGPQGLAGLQGVAGAPGPAGPTGSQGLAGSIGPTGATGSAGPAGPQGPKGDAGASGTGAGLPVCATPDVAVLYNGAFMCKSAVPHFMDNGDGTVTDNQTGLMWEQKTGTVGVLTFTDWHDVNNVYSWSGGTPFADGGGSLYTDFLNQLNGLTIGGSGAACFAGYCDWHIPTVGELRSILSEQFPACTSDPCIDPALGPTQGSYWSSTTFQHFPADAWYVYFVSGAVNITGKSGNLHARAVRGGR